MRFSFVTRPFRFTAFLTVSLSTANLLPAQDIPMSDAFKKALRQLEQSGAKAVPPIVIADSARNFRDVEREYHAWADRVLVQPGLARLATRGDLPWVAEARDFLVKSPRVVFYEQWQEPPVELGERAWKLLAAGCDDPAVLLLAAMVDQRCTVDRRFAETCAKSVLKSAAEDPSQKAVLSFHANILLRWAYSHGGFPQQKEATTEQLVQSIQKMAGDGSFLPEESELFLRHLYQDKLPDAIAGKLIEIAPTLPLPAWVQQTIIGRAEIELAWDARGSGWSGSVDGDGWKKFGEHLAKARTALVKSWQENPKSPLAAVSMISVVMSGNGESGETERLWFDRAIAGQCDHVPAYESLLWAYRPRWSGGHELMLAFGKACAATKRYDLEVPVQFTRACNDIVSEIGDWRAFYRRPDISKVLLEVSEGFVAEPTREYERPMRLSYLAVNAWLTGDFVRSAAALKTLGGPLHPDTLKKLRLHRVTEAEMREEVAVANSAVAADFKQADDLFEKGKLTEAAAIFQKIEGSATGEALEGIREKLQIIGIEQALQKGDWVTLPIDASLKGWLQRGGEWSGTPEGTLINTGSDTAGSIMHRARVGPNFEMSVEFSVDSQAKCCRRCDFFFDWDEDDQESYNFASYGQGGSGPAVAWIDSRGNRNGPKPEKVKIPFQDQNTLLLRSDSGKYSFSVNGKVAFAEIKPQDFGVGAEDGRVGIGSARWCRLNVTHIQKIQVRRLPALPQ